MQSEEESTLTPEFLETQLKTMTGIRLIAQTPAMVSLVATLTSAFNALQPEGYAQIGPAFVFRPVKE